MAGFLEKTWWIAVLWEVIAKLFGNIRVGQSRGYWQLIGAYIRDIPAGQWFDKLDRFNFIPANRS